MVLLDHVMVSHKGKEIRTTHQIRTEILDVFEIIKVVVFVNIIHIDLGRFFDFQQLDAPGIEIVMLSHQRHRLRKLTAQSQMSKEVQDMLSLRSDAQFLSIQPVKPIQIETEDVQRFPRHVSSLMVDGIERTKRRCQNASLIGDDRNGLFPRKPVLDKGFTHLP